MKTVIMYEVENTTMVLGFKKNKIEENMRKKRGKWKENQSIT